jgi:hypothetical protein
MMNVVAFDAEMDSGRGTGSHNEYRIIERE